MYSTRYGLTMLHPDKKTSHTLSHTPLLSLDFCAAEGSSGSNDDDQLGDLFKKELEKRNIQSIDDIKDSSQQQSVIAPPSFVTDNPFEDDSQLERSRNLNSEGLEGLIPRGSQLLQLGGSFFLAFGPFILFVLLSFGAVYSVFGDLFVHQGSPSSGVPQYIDPMDLLSEPTVDPMIPM